MNVRRTTKRLRIPTLNFESLEPRYALHGCQISFSAATYAVNEEAGKATITLTRNFAAGDVSFDFNAAIGSAGTGDFTPITGQTITFLNSDPNTKTVTVDITSDTLAEPNETIQLTLNNFSGTSPGAITTSALSIKDNDNRPPVLAGASAQAAYTENATPTLIASAGTVSDPDSQSFAFARLTATLTGGEASDRLTLVPQGSGAGQVSLSGTNVQMSGTTVGSFSGGAGTTPLAITFVQSATNVTVEAVLRRIAYSNISDNPSTAVRTIALQTSDGIGGKSTIVSVPLTVTAVNDAPKIVLGGSLGYVRGAAPVVLAAGASVSDVDHANFNGGKLTVSITAGGHAGNTLDFGGGAFSFSTPFIGGAVRLNGVSIGTISKSGFGATDLEITFNSSATPAIVQQLTRAVRFRATTASPAGSRTVSFTLTDGSGGTSLAATKTVVVS